MPLLGVKEGIEEIVSEGAPPAATYFNPRAVDESHGAYRLRDRVPVESGRRGDSFRSRRYRPHAACEPVDPRVYHTHPRRFRNPLSVPGYRLKKSTALLTRRTGNRARLAESPSPPTKTRRENPFHEILFGTT